MTRRIATTVRDCIDQAITDGETLTVSLKNILDDLIFDLDKHDERIIIIMDQIERFEKRIKELEKK